MQQIKTQVETLGKDIAISIGQKEQADPNMQNVPGKEVNHQSLPTNLERNTQQPIENNDIKMDPFTDRKDELIGVKPFLSMHPERMISSRYENPLNQLKSSTKRWKVITLCLAMFSFVYFSLNLWTSLTLHNQEILSETPQALVEMSNLLLEMQDTLFYSNTMNMAMDIWAIIIYFVLIVLLLKEKSTEIEPTMEEKGTLMRIMTRLLILTVILFGLSYIIGTGLLLYIMYYQVRAADILGLFIFHVSKLVYLLLNVYAFKKYRGKKFTYEDLLLEAIGPSEHEGDKSESEEEEGDVHMQFRPSFELPNYFF